MLDKDELKIAIEDARARQAAVIQLQYFLDTQAMNFLRMFITIQAALVTATVAIWGGQDWTQFKAVLVGSSIGVFFALIVGTGYCFRVMRTMQVTLPGRDPNFWLWGLDKTVTHDEVAVGYMQDIEQATITHSEANEQSAHAFKLVKIWGVSAPFFGVLGGVGGAVWWWIAERIV
jgi:hypothetical protein